MRRPGPPWAAVAAAALVLCLGAGCGGSSGSGVPTAKGGKAGATPKPSASYDGRKFAQCMRDHGVDMPDPDPNGGGGLRQLGKQDQATVAKALDACRDLAPPAVRDPDDPKTQDQMRKFAKCMRDHGVNVPDPDPALGGLGFPSGTFSTADPAFGKAFSACRGQLNLGGKK